MPAGYLRPNPSLLSRLVGYIEYSRCLKQLAELVETSSADELRVADEIVKEWDEYIVPVGNMRKEHGLAWVMAVARVELAGMIAVAMLDNSACTRTRPTEFERQAFIELLAYDTSHAVDMLSRDPLVRQLTQSVTARPNEHTVQVYCQRLTMIEAFIHGCLSLRDADQSYEKTAELKTIQRQIQQVRLALISSG